MSRTGAAIEEARRAARAHLVPGLGRIQLAKLTPMRVQGFLREELVAGKGRPTVKQSLVTLRMALKQAVVWGLVPATPPHWSTASPTSPPNAAPSPQTSNAAFSRLRGATGSTSWSCSRTRPDCASLSSSACAGQTSIGVGRTKVYELLRVGAIESVRIGRCRRIPYTALAAYVDRLRDDASGYEVA
jgi:excisionase family DNA binding protein